MTVSKKISIAKEFISLHKDSDLEDLMTGRGLYNDDAKLLAIYHELVGGVYGEVSETDWEHEMEIEISGFESKSGNPIMFNFELLD
jgi:hypothetical protein